MKHPLRLEVGLRMSPPFVATVFRLFNIVAGGKVPGSRKIHSKKSQIILEAHPSELTPWDQSQRKKLPRHQTFALFFKTRNQFLLQSNNNLW